jgi:hypothetical protein
MLGWQSHANYPLELWEQWLDLEPALNIGMLCGQASRIVGIDVDDQDAEEFVEDLEPEPTWSYTTGRGRRLLFRWSDELKSSVIKGEGSKKLEVLADGRNNVLPPSIHPSGKVYQWVAGCTPKEMPEPALLPGWARGEMLPVNSSSTSEVTSEDIDWVKVAREDLSPGQRNMTMTRLAGWLLSPAPHTQRETLWLLALINDRYCNPQMQMDELKSVVRSIGKRQEKNYAQIRSAAWDLARSLGIDYQTALEHLEKEV